MVFKFWQGPSSKCLDLGFMEELLCVGPAPPLYATAVRTRSHTPVRARAHRHVSARRVRVRVLHSGARMSAARRAASSGLVVHHTLNLF
jgi:hypothetical protein